MESLCGPLLKILVVAESALYDCHRCGESRVYAMVKLCGICIDVKHWRSRWCSVEKIGDVLNSDQNLVFGLSEKVNL
jgi:recombinational DNA repair protein RecR